MEEKIDNIIDRLCSHQISKVEAKNELLNSHGVIGCPSCEGRGKTEKDWYGDEYDCIVCNGKGFR